MEVGNDDAGAADDVLAAYADSTGKHQLGPWAEYAAYYNDRQERGLPVDDRGLVLLNLMRALIKRNKYNRAQTVLAAVKQVYLLRGDPLPAHDTAPSGRLEKLSDRAAQLQQEAIAVKGTGKPTMTMCLRKLHN